MVLTSCPSAMTASVVQDLTALPSRCTTQAPHCEVSQPTWVPVSRRFSRSNWTRRVRGSTLALTGLPFTISEILAIQLSLHLHPALHGSTVIKNSSKAIIWANPAMSNLIGRGLIYGSAPGRSQSFQQISRKRSDFLETSLSKDQPFQRSALHRLGEVREKLVSQFFRRTADQALAELGKLATDLRFDVIGQERAAVLVGERHCRAALGKAGHPALAFARDLVAIRRVQIAQRHPALEAGRHRPDLHLGDGAETVVFGALQLLAAGNTDLEHFRVVQLGPDRLARRRKLDFAVHRHGHVRSPVRLRFWPQVLALKQSRPGPKGRGWRGGKRHL